MMPQEDINKFLTQKNGCKGHQRSNPGVLFMWKISYLYHKQHRVGTMPLYYMNNYVFCVATAIDQQGDQEGSSAFVSGTLLYACMCVYNFNPFLMQIPVFCKWRLEHFKCYVNVALFLYFTTLKCLQYKFNKQVLICFSDS